MRRVATTPIVAGIIVSQAAYAQVTLSQHYRRKWPEPASTHSSMTRNRFVMRRVATTLIVAGIIVSQAAYAQVTLNFVNADIAGSPRRSAPQPARPSSSTLV